MNTITINFKNTCTSKPVTKNDKVNESINTKTKVQTDPLTFAELMLQGRTWCPATFNGGRSNANWTSQSVFALDFDSGILPEVIIARCQSLDIIPNVVYTSFSDSETLRKFRLVFFIDMIIKTQEKAKELQLTLMELFPECDASCKDYARMFFAAKEVVYVDEQINDTIKLAKHVINRRNSVNRSEVQTSLPAAYSSSSLFTQKSVMNDVDAANSNTTRTQRTKPDFNKSIRKLNKKNFNLDRAIERIQILQDFFAGEKLKHPQLFGLATNMLYINNGLDMMIEVMKGYNKEGRIYYNDDKFEMIEQVRKSDYKSQQIGQFSPYREDAAWKNVFTACLA